MPKYFAYKMFVYYVYSTERFVIECRYAYASDSKLAKGASAKFLVQSNGDAMVRQEGNLNEKELNLIRKFIKKNYREMYVKWGQDSKMGSCDGMM